MRLIDPKYRNLRPRIEYLTDEVVIAQAWKKTHAYMRSHNWYADTLALDISALGLESNASNWGKMVSQSDFIPYKMELVPAPKSQRWIVDQKEGWIREQKDKNSIKKDKPPIRPLAHLTIRDQTLTTAAMLCLADSVETVQGNCGEQDFLKAQDKGVYSYGNRLVCDWEDDEAWFRWGNNQTYRKFFTDYRYFLKRPVFFGNYAAESHETKDHIYIISLDIAQFYNCIDRSIMVERLKEICDNLDVATDCEQFWQSIQNITNWNWNKTAKVKAKRIGINLGKGLPQGLVAAGFLANSYLINFDEFVGSKIGNNLPQLEGVVLHDYCRYVDDLRLVISTNEASSIEQVTKNINNWINQELKKRGGQELSLNNDKTQIISLVDLDSSGSLSGRINQLQKEISGPVDRDTLDGAISILEGLLTTQTDGLPSDLDSLSDAPLLRVAKFDHDVRPDTLKRFAANRLEILMRNKRRLGEREDPNNEKSMGSIDNESELLAKKLIWSWIQDPSLSLVLRKAFEIYPTPQLLEPVLKSLYERCSFSGKNRKDIDQINSCLSDYVLADIFRFCIEFKSYYERIQYPDSADPSGMLGIAGHYAQKAISSSKLPIFVQRQALLLLAVLEKSVPLDDSEETIQHTLHKILAGKPIEWKSQKLALFEIAGQISGTPSIIARQLFGIIEEFDETELSKIIDELAKRGGDLWGFFWSQINKSDDFIEISKKFEWARPYKPSTVSRFAKQRLSQLIFSESNGFVHEAAFLKLSLELLTLYEEKQNVLGLSPSQLFVRPKPGGKGLATDWKEIWVPGCQIEVSKDTAKILKDPRFSTPPWLSDTPGADVIYWIGSILRAVVIGKDDYTGNRWKSGKINGYKGLRTNWYKRRMGMMHAPEALVGDYATLSTWASEFLMICLQWPGFESTHIREDSLKTIYDLESCRIVIENQISLLNDFHCEASKMPVVITKIKRPNKSNNAHFRLVTVQQLLPKTKDFSDSDPTLSSSPVKERNRDHLAKICSLTYKTLICKAGTEKEKRPAFADLIVFPEVAIHSDDQDILKRLADKTRSMIFAGMIFIDSDGKLVNKARWLIPDYRESGRQWVIRDQGKAHPTLVEKELGVSSFRPCQHIIEVEGISKDPLKITGAICYDSTDLKLASDLKNKSHLFVIPAHNKDVRTFDAMVGALHYHMYQHIVVVNKGQYGGSTMQAPYKESFERLISHAHGVDQISINVADLDLDVFHRKVKNGKAIKTPPAG
ncbi:MAG: hypothetical protein KKD32_04700 [Proteobacteria bacterium]|nr:hypothetical protein [Pseudomonadota bacterium]